jgi:hypothetical protein
MTNGVVVFENGGAPFADGTLVEVTPIEHGVTEQGDGSTPGKPGAAKTDPFADMIPVSKERREALLGLIGMWKTENPPDDAEVERIIEEARMRKYG